MFYVELFSIHFNGNPRATAAVLILTNYVRMLQSRSRLWAGCESQKRKRVISVLMDFWLPRNALRRALWRNPNSQIIKQFIRSREAAKNGKSCSRLRTWRQTPQNVILAACRNNSRRKLFAAEHPHTAIGESSLKSLVVLTLQRRKPCWKACRGDSSRASWRRSWDRQVSSICRLFQVRCQCFHLLFIGAGKSSLLNILTGFTLVSSYKLFNVCITGWCTVRSLNRSSQHWGIQRWRWIVISSNGQFCIQYSVAPELLESIVSLGDLSRLWAALNYCLIFHSAERECC